MKCTVLLENTACREDVCPEHGLSLFLETKDNRILFDMGQTQAFAANAQTLGVDLTKADLAVLSHGHYDHGGGLKTFLSINEKAPIYLQKTAFGDYYNGTEKYIGLDKSLAGHSRLILTEGQREIAPGCLLTDCEDTHWRSHSWGLNCRQGECFQPDSFGHEQYLLIREGDKRILISGCSHRGILNIARHFRPDVLIGGFHLSKETNPEALAEIAKGLMDIPCTYYTGHCTGKLAYDFLKEKMGERLHRLSTGLCFTL